MLRLLPGGAAGSPNVTFSTTSAPACQKCYIFQLNFEDFDMSFSKCSSRPHFSYIFCLASTCYENSDPPRLTKISRIHFLHIFPMVLKCFYVSAVRLQVGAKTINTMLRHDALKGAHVHENVLGVTFGTLRFGTHFRIAIPCSKATMVHIRSGTPVLSPRPARA